MARRERYCGLHGTVYVEDDRSTCPNQHCRKRLQEPTPKKHVREHWKGSLRFQAGNGLPADPPPNPTEPDWHPHLRRDEDTENENRRPRGIDA